MTSMFWKMQSFEREMNESMNILQYPETILFNFILLSVSRCRGKVCIKIENTRTCAIKTEF